MILFESIKFIHNLKALANFSLHSNICNQIIKLLMVLVVAAHPSTRNNFLLIFHTILVVLVVFRNQIINEITKSIE